MHPRTQSDRSILQLEAGTEAPPPEADAVVGHYNYSIVKAGSGRAQRPAPTNRRDRGPPLRAFG